MSEEDLPETVTLLKGPHQNTVYLIGTAHFSEESERDVIQTIQKVKPDVIVLELCASRRHVLSMDKETLLKEASELTIAKIRMIIKSNGTVPGLLHIVLLWLSAHITKQLGMAPGGEFRAAVVAANELENECRIILGDRPINITISRALAALNWWQRLKLLISAVTSSREGISKEEVERCKKSDVLDDLLLEAAKSMPQFTHVLLNERDEYLSTSIAKASSIANGSIVAVVGIGHVKGIVKNWLKYDDCSHLLR
ncbi:DgyrCDS7995 [Dimorphilus gyrociliatus]|uniref:DgyrCDS7995 n=1 Tax=Dimorphilus gyrociliatus TaxID=2664684 RepID=A0A7I8VSU7_9ANNE|nr:DgyrCDS7995 [Dimorphilus gyrociliatus]